MGMNFRKIARKLAASRFNPARFFKRRQQKDFLLVARMSLEEMNNCEECEKDTNGKTAFPRPTESFALAIEKVREFQRQGAYIAIILGVATDVALLGYAQQHGSLDVVTMETLPAIIAFNMLMGVAGSKLVDRSDALGEVRRFQQQYGMAALEKEVAKLRQELDNKPKGDSLHDRIVRWRQKRKNNGDDIGP